MGIDVTELYLPCQHVGVLRPNNKRGIKNTDVTTGQCSGSHLDGVPHAWSAPIDSSGTQKHRDGVDDSERLAEVRHEQILPAFGWKTHVYCG